ncbi:hypothetical protein [Hymenobacter glaciei]
MKCDSLPTPPSAGDAERQLLLLALEMQNEELQAAYQQAETARTEYASLYEHAPMAYLTLGPTEAAMPLLTRCPVE